MPATDGTVVLSEVVRRLDAAHLTARGLQLREPSLESETHRAPRSAMRAVTTVTTTATTTSTNDSAMAASGSVTRCR